MNRIEAINLLACQIRKAGGLPTLASGEFWHFDVTRARCGGWDYVLRRCPAELLTPKMQEAEAALRAEAQRLGEAAPGQVVFLLIDQADGRGLSDVVWVAPGSLR